MPPASSSKRFPKLLRKSFRVPKTYQDKSTTSLFAGASNFKISDSNFNEIHGNVTNIRFGDGQFTETERNLICDYIAHLTVLPDINDKLQRHTLTQSIITLPRTEATFGDYQTRKNSGPCFEGTRVALLREIAEWATGLDESRIYVLSGLAGIGKSTVAFTIAARVHDVGLLGASFFFSRDEADRRTAKKFFTTIAYQLCLYNESFAQTIGSVLVTERGSAATTGTPQEQVAALILAPLRSITASSDWPILIVVDALDECDADDAPSILEGLRRIVQDLPSFKVILTTRPKPSIAHYFATLSCHKIFHLQDIEDKVVNEDIRLYLKYSLSQGQVKEHLQHPTLDWYAKDAEIESLVQAAGKLFIIASTAVRFVLDDHWSEPARQMKTLLAAFAQNRTPFSDLSHFYTTILRSAIPADCHDKRLVERYQTVIGTIVLIQIPLSVDTLASLTDIDAEQISLVLRQLQPVILVGTDKIPIIYHKSFSDYITDSARCKDVNLLINPTAHHTWVAMRCFEINMHLKYNILGLDGPARFMDNKEGQVHQGISDGQLQEKIPSELRYACVYWANHLESANNGHPMRGLERFVNNHMLHWFETLSLIKQLDSAHRSIRVALKLLKPSSSELFQLLSDGLRFISKFYQIIERSALHTYYSALPFTPKESLLFRRYHNETADSICRITGGPEKWGALLATPFHGNTPTYVKFSLASTAFISSSWDRAGKIVKLWDAYTGAPVLTVSLDFDCSCAAITNDFSILASAKKSIITLYSVKSNTLIATFAASTYVQALEISSESNRVVAWLMNGTICLWDIAIGTPIASLGGFDEASAIFIFSPTGARLVYMPSFGPTMQLRDGINGAFIENIGDQSEERYWLVFSHDGSRFAVLTDRALSLYRSEDGELVGTAVDLFLDRRTKLAFSASGSLLATGNYGVKLWCENSGNTLELIDSLDFSPHSLAFAGDDMLAIGTYTNITLYDISSHSVISILPMSSPRWLAISPDCARLVARSDSSHVHLWDIQSIKVSTLSNPPSKGQAKRIRQLAFSSDCARLACYFKDRTIELWETGRTIRRIVIHHRGHISKMAQPLMFSPDGMKFAASMRNGTIKLWDSDDGAPIGSVQYSGTFRATPAVALSDQMIAASGDDGVIVLWDIRTLNPVGTVTHADSHNTPYLLSFSNNGDLLASYNKAYGAVDGTVTVLGVTRLTVIATFHISYFINEMAFLPDNSQLVVHFRISDSQSGDIRSAFQSFNLVSNEVAYGPTSDQLVQLRCLPIWRKIPVWLPQNHHKELPRLVGLFPQCKGPVPVLWIPTDSQIETGAHVSSMIALACDDGQVIFIQPSSSSVE